MGIEAPLCNNCDCCAFVHHVSATPCRRSSYFNGNYLPMSLVQRKGRKIVKTYRTTSGISLSVENDEFLYLEQNTASNFRSNIVPRMKKFKPAEHIHQNFPQRPIRTSIPMEWSTNTNLELRWMI